MTSITLGIAKCDYFISPSFSFLASPLPVSCAYRMSEAVLQPTARTAPQKLLPTLGLFSATMLVAGGVIGSGIFRKPGVMAAQVGSPELLLIVWLVAGIVSLLGTLSNAELASMMPQTGGQYVFLERAYGPFVAFLFGLSLIHI